MVTIPSGIVILMLLLAQAVHTIGRRSGAARQAENNHAIGGFFASQLARVEGAGILKRADEIFVDKQKIDHSI
jgi:hypothetical protein